MWLPSGVSLKNTELAFEKVLLDGVKSAEPPINSGNSPTKKSGQDELSFYWMNMVELSNELKMSLNKLERILFNHFRNAKNQS